MKRLIPHWRKMTWVIHVTNALFLFWIIAGVNDRPSQNCEAGTYLSKQDCVAASDAGTAIGVGLILFLWFLVFIVEAVIWFMTKPKPEQVVIIDSAATREP
jgi:hypothetical protein